MGNRTFPTSDHFYRIPNLASRGQTEKVKKESHPNLILEMREKSSLVTNSRHPFSVTGRPAESELSHKSPDQDTYIRIYVTSTITQANILNRSHFDQIIFVNHGTVFCFVKIPIPLFLIIGQLLYHHSPKLLYRCGQLSTILSVGFVKT